VCKQKRKKVVKVAKHAKQNTDGEHQQFLDIMKELGREIVPFVRRYEKLSFSSFDPINYTQLPPVRHSFSTATKTPQQPI